MLPDGSAVDQISPVINYTYARTRPILERMKKSRRHRQASRRARAYANPTTGGWALPTMGAHLALLPAGFKGEPYRSTDGMIFVCAEGSGQTKVGDENLRVGPRTTCSWCRQVAALRPHRRQGSVLFSISDRPMQEALGIWRETQRQSQKVSG